MRRRKGVLEWLILAAIGALVWTLFVAPSVNSGSGKFTFAVSCDQPVAEGVSVDVFAEEETPTARSRRPRLVLHAPATTPIDMTLTCDETKLDYFWKEDVMVQETSYTHLLAVFVPDDGAASITVRIPLPGTSQLKKRQELVIPVPRQLSAALQQGDDREIPD